MRPNDVAALAEDHRAAHARLKRHDVQADLNDEDGLARPDYLVYVEGQPHALRRVLEHAPEPPHAVVHLGRRGEVCTGETSRPS